VQGGRGNIGRMHIRRVLFAVMTVGAVVLSSAAPAHAATAAATTGTRPVDNTVVADNSNPSGQLARSNVKVVTDADGKVDSQNFAYSRSHDCTGCRTLAAAVEVVLIPNSPSQFAPVNAAVALNERCSFCQTFAAAYQYVVQTGGPTALGATARNQIASISSKISRSVASGKSFPEIDSELDQLTAQLWTVVNNDITAQGGTPSGTPEKN
jgi:hypothetical protein